ncbi:MAG: hypothetical protein IJR89_07535 [Clostridia bacterium]|nr:hypothetical protein [Clostridia bacterium]
MKEKSLFNSIALIFAFSFLLCSCQKTIKPGVLPDTEKVESAVSTGFNEKSEGPSPLAAPPQPLRFDSFESARDFIISAELSSYSEKEQEAYEKMNRVFRKDGFFYRASYREEGIPPREITLFPEAKYEDVGIGSWFVVDDVWYQFVVYHIREGEDCVTVENRLMNTSQGEYEIPVNVNQALNTILFRYREASGEVFFFGFLDDQHYFWIKGKASEDRIGEIIRNITFEKCLLESIKTQAN